MKRPLVILGAAPSTRELFPREIGAEVWSLAQNATWLPKADLWWELHEPQAWEQARELVEGLSPIIMGGPHIDGCRVYPTSEVLARFPRRYFTSSFAWQMAFALVAGYKEIHVYGYNMSDTEEYRTQRAGAEYFIGVAEGMGVAVHLPEGSALCKSAFLYALEPESELVKHLRDRYARVCGDLAKVDDALAQAKAERATYDGARQDLEYVLRMLGVNV